MYQISRSMYRRLAPLVERGDNARAARGNRRRVLEACESAMTRMAEDRRYFAHPERALFREIRSCFSMRDQIRVYTLVEGYVRLADSYLESLPSQTTAFGEQRRCRALTRQGTPCRREPLPGREYCPSHKHLEETEHWTHVPATSADRALARVA